MRLETDMEKKKIAPVSGDTEETKGNEKKEGGVRALWRAAVKNRRELAIWARYLLPVVALLTVFVMGWFYNVRTLSVGAYYRVSLWRLYGNTLAGTHTYLGGKTVAAKSWFYGLLSVGAIVGILLFLLTAFLTVLAAYTTIRAFRAGVESEESNRMKTVFKIAFPNRFCLFLSNALLLVPTLFPHFVALVGSRLLVVGGEDVIFVLTNPVLIVAGAFLLLTLLLSLLISKEERRCRMNMFLLHHAEPPTEEGEDEEEEDEED